MKINNEYPYIVECYSYNGVKVEFGVVDETSVWPIEGRQAVAIIMNEAPTDFRPFDVEW